MQYLFFRNLLSAKSRVGARGDLSERIESPPTLKKGWKARGEGEGVFIACAARVDAPELVDPFVRRDRIPEGAVFLFVRGYGKRFQFFENRRGDGRFELCGEGEKDFAGGKDGAVGLDAREERVPFDFSAGGIEQEHGIGRPLPTG